MQKTSPISKKNILFSFLVFLSLQATSFADSKVYYLEARDNMCLEVEGALNTDKIINMRGRYNGVDGECLESQNIVLKTGDVKITVDYKADSITPVFNLGCMASLLVEEMILTNSGKEELIFIENVEYKGKAFWGNGYQACKKALKGAVKAIKDRKVQKKLL